MKLGGEFGRAAMVAGMALAAIVASLAWAVQHDQAHAAEPGERSKLCWTQADETGAWAVQVTPATPIFADGRWCLDIPAEPEVPFCWEAAAVNAEGTTRSSNGPQCRGPLPAACSCDINGDGGVGMDDISTCLAQSQSVAACAP